MRDDCLNFHDGIGPQSMRRRAVIGRRSGRCYVRLTVDPVLFERERAGSRIVVGNVWQIRTARIVGSSIIPRRRITDQVLRQVHLDQRTVMSNEQLKLKRTESKDVTVPEGAMSLNSLSINERSILAVEVVDRHILLVYEDHAVLAADGIALGTQLAIAAATDEEPAIANINKLIFA